MYNLFFGSSGENLGKEKIVISVDHLDGKVVIKGWQETTGIKLFDALDEFLKEGFDAPTGNIYLLFMR